MDRAYTTNDYGYARAQEEYDRQEPPELQCPECPICGALLFQNDKLYTSQGEIKGCEYCLNAKYANEYFAAGVA